MTTYPTAAGPAALVLVLCGWALGWGPVIRFANRRAREAGGRFRAFIWGTMAWGMPLGFLLLLFVFGLPGGEPTELVFLAALCIVPLSALLAALTVSVAGKLASAPHAPRPGLAVWAFLTASALLTGLTAWGVSAGLLSRRMFGDREAALQAVSEGRILAIRVACGAYGKSHDGEWPPDLPALVEAGEIAPDELSVLPGRGTGGRYVYLRPPSRGDMDWRCIIVHEPFGDWPPEGVVAVLRDGRVLVIADQEEFSRLLPEG